MLLPGHEDDNAFGKHRADLITPGSVIKVVAVVTVDVCEESLVDNAKKRNPTIYVLLKSSYVSCFYHPTPSNNDLQDSVVKN
ncbi:hypothetical protein P9112_013499 [Eukaryota sp. TZLM1-RC]